VVGPGPWAGWCSNPGQSDQIGDNTKRGLKDRQIYLKHVGLGNHFGTRLEMMVPMTWFEGPGGGTHWGGTGICPTDDACNRPGIGTDCIRLDWSPKEGSRNGIAMQVYQHVGGDRIPEVWCSFLTDQPVFFENQWTTIIWEMEYTPSSGRLSGFMEFQHPNISGGRVRVNRTCTIEPGCKATIGEFAKWGKMSFNCICERDPQTGRCLRDEAGRWICAAPHPGKSDVCWVRNDHWYKP
jgi:hypothetical protein